MEINLQEAENTLAGADGTSPKRIVRLLNADGCEVQLTGKDSLKYNWNI